MWLARIWPLGGGKPRPWPAWLTCAWLALPPLVYADGSAPSARVLGVAESALNYCGPLEPVAAERLRHRIRQLVQAASEQQLAEVRNSNEYRKAYDSVVDFVAKIDPHNAKRFCAETATEHT
jgi:hypothetical protein